MKMLRLYCVVLVLVMLLSLLAGCGTCKHQWEAANCKYPKTCRLCGVTEGENDDEHEWMDATTEAPKTCSVCGLTQGDIIDVDERFSTDACKDLFGTWVGTYEQDGGLTGFTGFMAAMELTMRFFNDGEVMIVRKPAAPATLEEDFSNFLIDLMYQHYADLGMNKTQADAEARIEYGKDVVTYCKDRAAKIVKGMGTTREMVYYVEEGVLYIADDWGSDMIAHSFQLAEGKLQLEDREVEQTVELRKTATAK